MSKKMMIGCCVCICSIILISGCSGETSKAHTDKEGGIILKVADSYPTTNTLSSEGIVYFMDTVEELTDGKVKFEYYPAEQIGKAGDYLNLIQTGAIDIGYTSYATDKLPLTEVATLPGAYSSSQEGTEIFWRLMDELLLEEEYLSNDIRPLWAVPIPQYQIATKNKEVINTKDVSGLKVRVTGTMEYALDELGASPAFMAAPEAYTALERGTVDGVVFPFTSFKPYQMQEIINYATGNVGLGSFNIVYSIDEDLYQDLPDDVKSAMEKAGHKTMNHLSKELDQQNEDLREDFSSQMEITMFNDKEIEEWVQLMEPVWDRWAKDLEKYDFPANKTVEKYKKIKEEVEN